MLLIILYTHIPKIYQDSILAPYYNFSATSKKYKFIFQLFLIVSGTMAM